MIKKLAILIALVLVFVIGYYLTKTQFNKPDSKRQAVFLNNGQAYFGFLSSKNDQFIELADVYYLKTDDLAKTNDPNKKILLVKMGDELHSPQNIMKINRDQVLFYQEIKDGSKINNAIAKFAANPTTPTPSPTDTPSPAPNPIPSQ